MRAPSGLRALIEAHARDYFARSGTWSAAKFADSIAAWCGYSYAPQPLDKATREQVQRIAADVIRAMRRSGQLVGDSDEALSLAGTPAEDCRYVSPAVERNRSEDADRRAVQERLGREYL